MHFSNSRLLGVATVVAGALAAPAAWAIDPFAVRDIRVEGLQRVEPGTVFATVPLHVGDTYTDERGSASIRALFELGVFKDVRIDVRDGTLIVIVEERPTVADVDFVGAKEFDKKALLKALAEVGLAEGRAYDKALTDRAEQEIKRQYVSRSLYNATVVTTVTPIDRNRVNLNFNVTEGEPARIREIRIVGQQAFSEDTLLSLFDQDSGGWMSWYTKSNQYSRTKLNADLETLRSYYLTRGYMEFRIDSTQVAVSPDREDLSVTLNITEGERFVVAGVRLEGDYLAREKEFQTLLDVRVGEPYNGEQVTATTKAFTDYYASFGYAFARVAVQPEIDRERRRVTLVLKGEPQRRVYVRRVNIGGNSRTRDEVIRREFRQYEASWYDGDKIKLSRDRVDRLGYFTDIDIQTQEIAGSPDEVDLVVDVKEKPTGSLQLGAGFSTSDSVTVTFGITQENVFGSGNYLGLSVSLGSYSKAISLSATDPYFTRDGISRTVSAFYSTSRPYYDVDGNYELVHEGASIKFGVPFNEIDRVFFGIGLEKYHFDPGSNGTTTTVDGTTYDTGVPQSYGDYFGCSRDAGSGVVTNCTKAGVWGIPLTVGWSRDDRDSALVPTKGRLQSANLEVGIGGDMRYLRSDYQYQQYFALNKQYTLAVNGQLGYAKALAGQTYPVFKNFYAGGLGSVRGFESNSLGPRDSVTDGALGGTRRAIFNAELSTPFPGAGNDRTLRLYSFFDMGNVFAERSAGLTDAQWKAQQALRASVGLGISWISPLGPLRVAYAIPVKYQKADDANGIAKDRTQSFQFQIGTAF